MLAGLYYWLPHISGRKRVFRLGELAFGLIFVGFHVTFLAMHWVGLLGQRRRISTYLPEDGWTTINLISSIGGFITAIGIAVVIIDVILQLLGARRGKRNPWKASTLEWAMMNPPAAYNFASLPHVTSRDPLTGDPNLAVRLAQGQGYLGRPQSGWRETLTVEIATGKPDFHVIYPRNTRLPIVMAAVTGVFFLSLLLKFYWTIPIAMIGVAALAWWWAWSLGRKEDLAPVSVGQDIELPNAVAVDRSPGWWGSLFLLTANATFFGSLLFGFAFLWTVAPGWPPPAWFEPSAVELATGVLGALFSVAAIRLATRANNRGGPPMLWLGLALAATLAVAGACILMLLRAPSPVEHAYNATLFVLGGYGLFHAALAALMVAFLAAQAARGFTSPARRALFPIVGIWIDYLAVVGPLVLVAAHLPGILA
jgi:cytochrome c oxidase subunit I+III